jgi:uncharacterized protein (DUF302 family)
MSYGYKKKVDMTYDEALTRTKEELQKEGFGVLTEIDVRATLKKKLDVDFDNYAILGACNPPLAYQALRVELDVGLLLPCNVIVYEMDGETFVSAIVPSVAMSMVQNEELGAVAVEVEQKLERVLDAIAA